MPATRSNPLGSADPAPPSAPSPRSPPAASSRSSFAGAASSGPRPCRRSARSTSRRRSRSRRSPVDRRRRRHAGLQPGRPGRDDRVRARRAERHVGLQRLLPRPDDRRDARRARAGRRRQLARRADHRALARHAPAGRDGRRPAPDGRAGCHVVARVGHRPAGGDALVPPAPARRDRGRTSRAASPGMFIVQDDAEARARRCRASTASTTCPSSCRTPASRPTARARAAQRGFAGGLGDELLVNGTRGPYLDVHDELVRLRLLNASTARSYAFTWSDGRPVELIATDGGLLEASVDARPACCCRPANAPRCSCASTPGERVVLRSEATADVARASIDSIAAMNGGTDAFDVLELRAADALDAARRRAGALATAAARRRVAGRHHPHVHARRLRDQRRRRWTWAASTRPSRSTRPSAGSSTNTSQMPHSFHVHDVQFRIASIDGAPPPPELAGWKDTDLRARPRPSSSWSCASRTTPTPTPRTCTTATCCGTRTRA